jgi:hypothetical protein
MDAAQSTTTNQVDAADRFNSNKSIYDASAGEIFIKNFLAGFGRAFGGLFLYVILIAVTINAFVTQVWPKMLPFVEEYQQAVQGLNKANSTSSTQMQQYKQLIQDLPVTPSK